MTLFAFDLLPFGLCSSPVSCLADAKPGRRHEADHKTLLGLLVLCWWPAQSAAPRSGRARRSKKKADAKEKSENMFDLDKSQVKELRLSKEGQLVARMEKGDKGWKLAEPVRADADDTVVDSLLGTLSALKQKKDLGEEKDLKAFGHRQPRLGGGPEARRREGRGFAGRGRQQLRRHAVVKSKASHGAGIDAYQKASFERRHRLATRGWRLDDGAEVKRIEATGVNGPTR